MSRTPDARNWRVLIIGLTILLVATAIWGAHWRGVAHDLDFLVRVLQTDLALSDSSVIRSGR